MSDIDNDTSKKETRIERWIDRQRGEKRERERDIFNGNSSLRR